MECAKIKWAVARCSETLLPTRGTVVPVGTDWLHEIKHDGYRLLVRKDGDAVSIITRGGYARCKIRYERNLASMSDKIQPSRSGGRINPLARQ